MNRTAWTSAIGLVVCFSLILPGCGSTAVTAGGGAGSATIDNGGTGNGPDGSGSTGNGGGSGSVNDGTGDGGGGSTDGTGGDIGTDGAPDGGGDGTGGTTSPPAVALSSSGTIAAPGQLVFLICTVLDDGGSPVTRFSFQSSAGGAELTQDGSATATAFVPEAPLSITYTCTGTNEAGTSDLSNPVTVTVTNG